MLENGRLDSLPSHSASLNDAHAAWQLKSISRYRFNVLDLLDMFGRKAIMYHLFADIDMTVIENFRQKAKREGNSLTVTAFLLKAIAVAQQEHRLSRTFYLPGLRMVTYVEPVAGFTVERLVDGAPAVFFGEIEEPQELSLKEIGSILKAYADRDIEVVPKLRQQKLFAEMPRPIRQVILRLAELFPYFRAKCMAATFGLSSLGALGVSAVCGPSVCTCVFGVGEVKDRVVVEGGKPVVKPIMTLALSFDQRILTSYEAARFFQDVLQLLEGGLDELKELKDCTD
ncbi:MAG: 2-oxo acid dehydrogenase subunit E2 [Candidatus Obscuribacterales bacterium]|nr:2-oxo acid dehydrogenase subunit E2 [Candidatus Obscuribacterales bacterium]